MEENNDEVIKTNDDTIDEKKEETKQEQTKQETVIYFAPDNNDYSSTDVGRIQSFFDGGLLQLIGWKLLGGFLTLITLGILYPLSYCLIYKWEMKHTVINGRRLSFDGQWYQLWGKWIVWMLLSLITFGIYSLWIPIKKNKWILKHTHYEDTVVDEDNNQSDFDGGLLQLIGWNILGILLTTLSLGLLAPFYICLIYNWRINHTIVDGDRMEFDGRSIQLFGLWIKWGILTFITLGIYSLWIPISIIKWEKKHTNKVGVSENPYSVVKGIILSIIFALLTCGFLTMGIVAYKDNAQNPFKGVFTDKDGTNLNKFFKINI